uniref:Lipid droplet-associated hydrolase n=1 Tax=Athene cunicularia TaxID=194338 RepID=A0A663MND7_ATHCN
MRSVSEEPVPLHEEFIYCCGAATHVLKCGPWKDLSKDESKNLPRLLFMIIPGNPGLAGYYRTFIQALYCGLNQQYPVWVVSHAGHYLPKKIKKYKDVFGLNGQVEHKLNFLKKNVSKDIKLVLIAHSIGCYITLEMMKRASELQNCCVLTLLHVSFSTANILYMASQEMMKVVERDSTTIKQNLKKLIFYYGTGDSWCPQHYYDEIKMDFPDGDIRLCEKGLRHAFVLDASKEMALLPPHSPAGELSGMALGQPSWPALERNTRLLCVDKNPPVNRSWQWILVCCGRPCPLHMAHASM